MAKKGAELRSGFGVGLARWLADQSCISCQKAVEIRNVPVAALAEQTQTDLWSSYLRQARQAPPWMKWMVLPASD